MRTIGRLEEVDLPDFEMEDLNAKIDSGAYTSSIHAHAIRIVEEDDKRYISFKLLDPEHPQYSENKELFGEVSNIKYVKSSNGFTERRYAIKTRIKIGKKNYKIEFTLTDRRDMKNPILLGRKFLRKKFLIDVSKKNLLPNK